MIDELPPENERNGANPDYEKFLMKILTWKVLIQTPLWYLCGVFVIPFMGLMMNHEDNPFIWIFWFILSFFMTFALIMIIAYPISKWYYHTMIKNHWWALGENVIFVHSGVLTHQLARIPYERIQNLNTKSGWFDRRGNFFKIEIETAGRSGAMLSEGIIFGIKNPEEIIQKIAPKINSIAKETIQNIKDKSGINLARLPETKTLESATDILKMIYKKLESIEDLLKQK